MRLLRNNANAAKVHKMWDTKSKEIDTYMGGRQCTEDWKFVNAIKRPTKNKLSLNPIKPREWIN